MKLAMFTTFAILAAAAPALAEVTDKSAAGFQSTHTVAIAAPPARVFQAVADEVGKWWTPDHTYSGDAANLSIDLATGCFCEKLAKGEVRHMQVVYHDGTSLVLSGGLGPLATTGASGHLAFRVKETGGQSQLTLTYDVGGYAKGGLAEVWAAPVDSVLGMQVARLKLYVETGKAE